MSDAKFFELKLPRQNKKFSKHQVFARSMIAETGQFKVSSLIMDSQIGASHKKPTTPLLFIGTLQDCSLINLKSKQRAKCKI